MWEKLSNEWKIDTKSLIDEKSFNLLPQLLENMLKGETKGRVIIHTHFTNSLILALQIYNIAKLSFEYTVVNTLVTP